MAYDIQDIEKIAKHAINEVTGIDEEDISAASTLESMGLDSLDLIEIIVNLEDELGTELDFDIDETHLGQVTFEQFLELVSEQ